MVDDEVEIVLREIRERVISQTRAEQMASPSTLEAGNGNGALIGTNEDESSSAAALARLEGYLTTTGRAWDRLPPVFSNRAGAMARLELWLKTRAKSLARWFTWEQVNFNAAADHALREIREALLQQERAIASLRTHVRREGELRDSEFEKVAAQLAEISTRIDALAEARRIDLQVQRAELHGESESRRIQIEDATKQLSALVETYERRQAAQILDLRERDEGIESEHRASFKQLSLGNSEAAAFLSTSRRKLESAIADLDQRIRQLEAGMKQGK